MKYIREFHEGDRIRDIYLCRNVTNAVTKNGKEYQTVALVDKTGAIDGKIWDPTDAGIDDFSKFDYIEVTGDVTIFNNMPQINIKRVRVAREGEYDPSDYLPVSPRDNDEMYASLKAAIETVKNPYYHQLLTHFFVEDEEFVKVFRRCSAAKSVHHGYVGGLMEHTLGVARMCEFMSRSYPFLDHDLLLTAALCHDIAKTKEFTPFPENDYTDEGQLLGHIVMGSQMVGEAAARIEGFPHVQLTQLQHCILAHHGKYEFGSPKLPALVEAVALNYADDTDAKMEIFKELLENNEANTGWLGYNRLLDSNVRATKKA